MSLAMVVRGSRFPTRSGDLGMQRNILTYGTGSRSLWPWVVCHLVASVPSLGEGCARWMTSVKVSGTLCGGP